MQPLRKITRSCPRGSRAGRWSLFLLPVLVPLGSHGCSGSGGDDQPLPVHEGPVRDSAGILITETADTLATASLQWVIDSIPTLVLGDEDREEEVFFGIRGLRSLPGGGVLVLDGSSRELRFFDSTGHLYYRTGRKGEGPGEFDSPHLVRTLRSDSLLFWDGRLQRFQVFTEAGEFVRTINLRSRWPAGWNPPRGSVGSLQLVQYRIVTREMYPDAGPVVDDIRVLWSDLSDGMSVPIVSFQPVISYVLDVRGRPGGSIRIPFTLAPFATVSASAALVCDGVSPEIREYDVDGNLRRIFRVPGFERPVDREVEQGMVEYWMGRNGWSRGDAEWTLDAIPNPTTLPPFQSLQVDEVGWIWAELYHWDRTRPSGEWMIFDPEGRARGTLRTPEGLRIQRIGRDFLLGVHSDELGVEEVRRYAIRRGTAAETGNDPGGSPDREGKE